MPTLKIRKKLLSCNDNFLFRFVANVFLRAFSEINRMFFTAYSFTHQDVDRSGAKRAIQRFEQCLGFLSDHMRPALEALGAATFYNRSVQKSATELVELAVADAIYYIGKNDKISAKTRDFILDKLKSVKVWVMFPDEVLNATRINSLYNELDDGSESLVELSINIRLHNGRILMNSGTLMKIIEEDSPYYNLDENVLSELLDYFPNAISL